LRCRNPQLLADQLRASWARQRVDTALFSGFGLAALALAAAASLPCWLTRCGRDDASSASALLGLRGRLQVVRLVHGEGMAISHRRLWWDLTASLALTRSAAGVAVRDVAARATRVCCHGRVLIGAALLASRFPPGARPKPIRRRSGAD
jgi:hypothetical protein